MGTPLANVIKGKLRLHDCAKYQVPTVPAIVTTNTMSMRGKRR